MRAHRRKPGPQSHGSSLSSAAPVKGRGEGPHRRRAVAGTGLPCPSWHQPSHRRVTRRFRGGATMRPHDGTVVQPRKVPPTWSSPVQEGSMHYSSTAALITVVLAATAEGAGAQAPTSTVVPEHQAAISALRDSQWVRVVTPGLTRQQCRLLSHASDTLRLDHPPPPFCIAAFA
jgi:hypothetical protein